MSVYMTEEEQLEAIKKWWQRYSTILLVVFSIVMLSVSGYRYWQWHQIKVSTEASNAYEHLMVAFANQDSKGISAYANQLSNSFSKTVYADAAQLALAKWYATDENLDKALEHLQVVANNSTVMALKQVARIRIARIMAAQKKYDTAMSELDNIDDVAYLPVVNELKGDIYAATGEYQKATVAYKEAMTAVRTQGLGNLYLEMKTNELAALSNNKTSLTQTTEEAQNA